MIWDMVSFRFNNIILVVILAVITPTNCRAQEIAGTDNGAVIYSTDLSTPPGDPDDHFDLLTALSIPGLNIQAVVIDYPHLERDRERGRQPNCNAVQMVVKIFDRKDIPCEAGIRVDLDSPGDKVFNVPGEQQQAIQLILKTLKSNPDKSVRIVTNGSLRDVAAAYNREPELFHKKVKKIIISGGDSYGLTGIEDTNVSRGVNAWKSIMNSGLPIDWMPCNPSKGRGGPSPFVSYWYFIQHEIKPFCSSEIIQFLLSEGIDLGRRKQSNGKPVQRHMWSTPAFIELAGLKCYQKDEEIKWLTEEKAIGFPGAELLEPYEFVPINIALDETGVAKWEKAVPGAKTPVRLFKINDYYLYNKSMFLFLTHQFHPR